MKAKTRTSHYLRNLLTGGALAMGVLCLLPNIAFADLTHRYSFTNDVTDSVGRANGTVVGNATVSNGSANFPGMTNADYIELPPGLISNYTTATFEFWISPGVNGTWPRIFDFGNQDNGLGANEVYFTPHSGPGDFRMSYAQADPGFNDEHATTGP